MHDYWSILARPDLAMWGPQAPNDEGALESKNKMREFETNFEVNRDWMSGTHLTFLTILDAM